MLLGVVLAEGEKNLLTEEPLKEQQLKTVNKAATPKKHEESKEKQYFSFSSAQDFLETLKDDIIQKHRAEEGPLFSKALQSLRSIFSSKETLVFAMTAAIRIIVIVLLFVILWRSSNRFINYYLKRFLTTRKRPDGNSAAFVKTVAPILHSTVHWVLIVITMLLILSEMNVNIMPIIYSFSVIGLAISIGSQTLVKDLINGVLMLFEGNMAVGDFIKIGEHEGYVESITLRCVHLRHKTGELRTIPFSEVNSIANFYREFNMATVKVFVAHEADIIQIEDSMRLIFERFKNSEDYQNNITGGLSLTGVTQVNEYGMILTCKFRVRPDESKNYVSQFTKFLMLDLQSRNIPFPKP